MPVSSNSLFHFTNSADHLFNILKNDFIPHFSLETFYAIEGTEKFAFPMVCFCDIPLSQVKEHLKVYGNYGIGLSKKWAKLKKLNPVFYLIKNSLLDYYLWTTFSIYITNKETLDSKIKKSIAESLKHFKVYEEKFDRSPEPNKPYRFYNEREWRYSPENTSIIGEAEYKNPVARNRYNLEVENRKLTFTPDDITYLILNDETEISEMILSLKRIKSPKYDDATIEKLISRILTSEQILNDF